MGSLNRTKKWNDDDERDLSRNSSQGERVYSADGLSSCLNAHGGGLGAKTGLYAIPVLTPNRENKRQNGRRFKTDGEPMFTLTGQDIHGVMVGEATSKGYAIAEEGDSINLSQPNSKTRRGRVGKGVAQTIDTQMQQYTIEPRIIQNSGDIGNRKLSESDIAYTIRTTQGSDGGQHLVMGARIRRLTPTECERLQGFPDGWTDGVSDTQRYKCLGNAVTVNKIRAIMERL
jgi:DNA (cytosine-5)-methyltransferase 1